MVSILGLYEYDNTVLDGLIQNLPKAAKIPADDVYMAGTDLNADALVTELLAQSSELEFIYPNPDAARKIIAAWAIVNAERWQKLYNTMWFRYNPIWNKDGTSTHTETETRDLSATDIGTSTNKGSGKEERNLKYIETPDTTLTETGKVAGYNSSDFVNSEQRLTESGGTNTRTDSGTVENNASTDSNTKITKTDRGTITRTFSYRDTGNIGVTATQAMIKDERAIVDFNMSQNIINDFISRFCILVY
jgi:hypothetical protein